MLRARGWRLTLVGMGAWLAACGGAPGQAPAPGAFVDPDAPGPFGVLERPLRGAGSTLYLPTVDGQDTLAPFPRPTVIFIPGFSGTRSQYEGTILHLVQHGVAVAAVDRNLDPLQALVCRTQLDVMEDVVEPTLEALLHASAQGGAWEGLLQNGVVGTAGHSLGGKMALWLATRDPRVAAAAVLDPVDSGGGRDAIAWCGDTSEGFASIVGALSTLSIPVMLLGAGQAGECAPAEGNSQVLFDALPGPAVHHVLPQADHTDFTDAAASRFCPACNVCPAGTDDAADVLRYARATITAHLLGHLGQDARYLQWLQDGRAAVVAYDGFVSTAGK